MDSKPCPKGKILRAAYETRRGSKKGSVKVKASCVKDRGRVGHGPSTLPPIGKDIHLSDFGYAVKDKPTARRASLKRASKKHGPLPVLRHINLIRNYSKSVPDNYLKLSADVDFMKDEYSKVKKKRGSKK